MPPPTACPAMPSNAWSWTRPLAPGGTGSGMAGDAIECAIAGCHFPSTLRDLERRYVCRHSGGVGSVSPGLTVTNSHGLSLPACVPSAPRGARIDVGYIRSTAAVLSQMFTDDIPGPSLTAKSFTPHGGRCSGTPHAPSSIADCGRGTWRRELYPCRRTSRSTVRLRRLVRCFHRDATAV
jgi:hypothetical protein